MNFMYDIKLNWLGTTYAAAGVLTTSFYQVVRYMISIRQDVERRHNLIHSFCR